MKEEAKYKDYFVFNKALELINKSRYILIVTHINPDADTISSALALSNYFKENKVKHTIFNKMITLPSNLDFLDNFHKINNQLPKFYDLIISVDCANLKRVGIKLDSNVDILNIDHHQSNDNFGLINIVDDTQSSNAEVLYSFFEKNNLNISKKVAQCLYVGLYDDSLAFTTPRCDSGSFEKANHLVRLGADPTFIADKLLRRDSLAKYRLMPLVFNTLELHLEGKVATIYVKDEWFKETGALYTECEEFVNTILRIGIVNISIFFRSSKNGIRASIRSKNNIDISNIASNFNGGGHKMAAGCTLDTGDIDSAKHILLDFIKELKIVSV
jgi:bifunctional oligoribonuclease and PAP phosphatase NrnA